jgi:pantoate kinase
LGIECGATPIAEPTEEQLGVRTGLDHVTVVTGAGDVVALCHRVVYRKKQGFPDNRSGESNLAQMARHLVLCYTEEGSQTTIKPW